MGGRGTAAKSGRFLLVGEKLPTNANVITHATPLGNMRYPFLEQTQKAWQLVTHPVDAQIDYSEVYKSDIRPTLRWITNDKIHDLFVDGMSTQQFLDSAELKLNMHKGGFVLSKRLSRIMRPHKVSGFFAKEDISVAYMEQSADEAKAWDGAALISRRMVNKLLADMPTEQRAKIEHEMQHTHRFEFTLISERGQDKGHSLACENLRDVNGNAVDFLLPKDTKHEVSSTGDSIFIGLAPVHGHDHMRLDIQSLINLHPFFSEDQLLSWLKDEGKQFIQSIEDGSVADVMSKIDRHATLEEVENWPLRAYLASGGHPMWFSSHVRGLVNQHLKRLNHQTLEKLRLPIPGMRQYVLPAAIGRKANLNITIPRGHIQIDPNRGTAWVNDEDWLSLQDSPDGSGIADILGGADNDDALWLHGFTDHDGEQKVLAWRSPNQMGEYLVLKPTADSTAPIWDSAENAATIFPSADSRKLPKRIDHQTVNYLNLVDPDSTGGVGQDEAYTVEVMDNAIDRALANQGSLGAYCNSLMVNKAVFGRLPDNPPAPLESVIDSTVKTGADLSQVVEWNYENTRSILEKGVSIPKLLSKRLSIDYGSSENLPPRPRWSRKHWLDRLHAGIKSHISDIERRRDQLAKQARPPAALFDVVFEHPEDLELARGLHKTFSGALNAARKETKIRPKTTHAPPFQDSNSSLIELAKSTPPAQPFEVARRAAEQYLSYFPPTLQKRVLRSALALCYLGEVPNSDAVAWLAANSADSDSTGIASRTLSSLREACLIDEMTADERGLLTYPNAQPLPTNIATVGIPDAWLSWIHNTYQSPIKLRKQDVAQPLRKLAKEHVQAQAQSFTNSTVTLREESERLVAYANSVRLGVISAENQPLYKDGDTLHVRHAVAHNGHLRLIFDQQSR